MKVLFVTHVANFQKFNNPYIKWLQDRGVTVHYASLDDEEITRADAFFKVDFRRNPLNPLNIKAFFQLKGVMKRGQYDLIHCHTPIGGILARMAAPRSAKVIYTAHGFHFFKGAPLKNFLIYRTAEALMARRTDALVTINREDFQAAQAFHLKRGGEVFLLNGVGVDVAAVKAASSADNSALKRELGIDEGDFVVLTVAELIKRKNYETALSAFARAEIPRKKYLICGRGAEEERLRELCSTLGIADRVRFLGYRRDIYNIIGVSDAFLFPSHQEGLPIALIEAMAGGLPCAASDIRGNNELIDSSNGFILPDSDADGFAHALERLHDDPVLRSSLGAKAAEDAEEYDLDRSVQAMGEIYRRFLDV